MARDVEPGVVVESQAREFCGRLFRCCHRGAKHRFKHELAQFLDARLRPGEKIVTALEHLRLRVVRRRGVLILLRLPGQEQLLELAVESIAGFEPGVANGHGEGGSDFHAVPYPNRIIANTRISAVSDLTTETSCGTCAGNSAMQPGAGVQV